MRHPFLAVLGICGLLGMLASSPHQEVKSAAGSSGAMRINEVLFYPNSGQPEWVELKNAGTGPVSLKDYRLTDEDDNWYRFPGSLPSVPAGAFVVIVFDGAGSAGDDYDFSDNLATLHSPAGMVNIFEDDADQVALYTPYEYRVYLPSIQRGGGTSRPVPGSARQPRAAVPPVVSFVAWGADPGADAQYAVKAGLWMQEGYIGITRQPGEEGISAGGSTGFDAGEATRSAEDWTLYRPGETTRGAENGHAAPAFRNPPDGISICEHQIPFGWTQVLGAASFHLEVDNDPNFGSPLVSVDTTESSYLPTVAFPDGTFYFRVKARGADAQESSYSSTGQVTFIDCSVIGVRSENAALVLLGVTPKLQHKDTRMLCLDGDWETGEDRWDSAHESDGDWIIGNGTPIIANFHDSHYCTRASISMIVAYHGGNLSQDRISFYQYGEGYPEEDLGHRKGLGPNVKAIIGIGKNVFDWAMNGNAVTSVWGKPTFDQIKGWIDAHRPLLVVEQSNTHSVVVDGYYELSSLKLAHRIDPGESSGGWVVWDTWNTTQYHVPPAGVTPRSDEDENHNGIPDTIEDSDGDGICDFDEKYRFHTDPVRSDTDGDGVPDKLDIREYMFLDNGHYRRLQSDYDNDGLRKELDNDNDDDCVSDGQEDTNHNGKNEPSLGEGNNFNQLIPNIVPCSMNDGILGKLLFVPAGNFMQGSPTSENCRWADREAQFSHTLTKNLLVMETAVTRQMWANLRAVQSSLPIDPSTTNNSSGMSAPVLDVSWYKTVLFANLLSLQNGRKQVYYTDAALTTPITSSNYQTGPVYADWSANGYRLPTEGEREYFTRAGTTGPFSIAEPAFSGGFCGCYGLPALESVAWYCANFTPKVHPAGSKAPNPWGLRDVHGNAYEWVWDWYASYPTPGQVDYRGPVSGSDRAFRGGAWNLTPDQLRSAYRNSEVPSGSYYNLGFRLLRLVDLGSGAFGKSGLRGLPDRSATTRSCGEMNMASRFERTRSIIAFCLMTWGIPSPSPPKPGSLASSSSWTITIPIRRPILASNSSPNRGRERHTRSLCKPYLNTLETPSSHFATRVFCRIGSRSEMKSPTQCFGLTASCRVTGIISPN